MKSFMIVILALTVILGLTVTAVNMDAQEEVPPVAESPLPGGTLDPVSIPKYVDELFIPPVLSAASTYRIAARQFQQQVLPSSGSGPADRPFPKTTVWGYGPSEGPLSAYSWPGPTIQSQSGETVRVRWDNYLVDNPDKKNPSFLPHLFAIDQTLHWANPSGVTADNAAVYKGPVPIVTHLHGSHVRPESDGYPEAWYLPKAGNIPKGYSLMGPKYATTPPEGEDTPAGSAWFEYPNDQRATTLWYHDHTVGMTRLNVYAGLAGLYLIRDEEEASLGLPSGDYEVPLLIQDRSFNRDGSLFYPSSRKFFDGYPGPYVPASDIPPTWNPEFFGNTNTVNGKTWPNLNVERGVYRFRFLNGSDSRFYILKIATNATERPAEAALKFYVIGSDGGLLSDEPVELDMLLIGPAERYDVLVDFSGLEEGDVVYLVNEGPDEPFGGGEPGADFSMADPGTTGQVMRFSVMAGDAGGTVNVGLPSLEALGNPDNTRDLTLNEQVSETPYKNGEPWDGPIMAMLGTAEDGMLHFMDAITEKPELDTTEVWQIINLTEDAHPIHLHLVQFEVVNRQELDAEAYMAAQETWLAGGSGSPPVLEGYLIGDPVAPEEWEKGRKDTVIVYPGGITRIKAHYDIAGLFLWHCHILSHEDNDMMRPYEVIE